MSDDKSSLESMKRTDLDRQSLLAMYKECGAHIRFYAEARFKVMTIAITLVSALIAAQGIISAMGRGAGLVLGLVGLASTIVLFSIEYRYTQAWLTLTEWAERNVEDELLGKGEGPLNSYKDLPKPWYILKSKGAPNILYSALILDCVLDVAYYVYRVVVP